jgi:hypothetical protein
MGEESANCQRLNSEFKPQDQIPPMFIPLALGVLSPSEFASAPAPVAAPEADAFAGEERKNKGDAVEPICIRWFRGVAACEPRNEACEASFWSCSSGPGLEGICEFWAPRALLLGVAEAGLRCERRCAGEDMVSNVYRMTCTGQ